VLFEELDEGLSGDAAILAAGNAVARSRPESNHLLTVRGATLQILATWPVVKDFFYGRSLQFMIGRAKLRGGGLRVRVGKGPLRGHRGVRAVAGTTARAVLPGGQHRCPRA